MPHSQQATPTIPPIHQKTKEPIQGTWLLAKIWLQPKAIAKVKATSKFCCFNNTSKSWEWDFRSFFFWFIWWCKKGNPIEKVEIPPKMFCGWKRWLQTTCLSVEVSSKSNEMTNYLKSDFEKMCTNSLETAAQILFLCHSCDDLLPIFSNLSKSLLTPW